jgi:uncharacterized RDD family membrane protein YckC
MMDGISIQTTQNVDIELEKAGVGDRILAYIIDLLVMAGYFVFIFLLLTATDFAKLLNSSDDFAVYAIMLVIMSPVLLYNVLFEYFMNGQSPGKRVLKLKVVKVDGTRLTIGSVILRALVGSIEKNAMYGMIAIIAASVNKKGQRLGDMAAGTTVISLKKRVDLSDTVFEDLMAGYEPVFTNLSMLSSKDIEVIKQVLKNKKYRDDPEVLYRLRDKIRTKMGIDTQMEPLAFLQTVVRDYTYYG